MENSPLLESTLQRQLQWISAADAKVSPVMTMDTAMLAVLAAFAPKAGEWTWLLALLTAAAILSLGCSLVHLFLAGFPRTKGPKGSLVYFGGITERTEEQFVNEILTPVRDKYLADLAQQCYRNAEIAGEKFRHVKVATQLLFVGLLPWLLSIYWMYGLKSD